MEKGAWTVKFGLCQMLMCGVIMDVVTPGFDVALRGKRSP